MLNGLRDLMLGLKEFFNEPEIKTATSLEEFSTAAANVIARMEKSEIPAS